MTTPNEKPSKEEKPDGKAVVTERHRNCMLEIARYSNSPKREYSGVNPETILKIIARHFPDQAQPAVDETGPTPGTFSQIFSDAEKTVEYWKERAELADEELSTWDAENQKLLEKYQILSTQKTCPECLGRGELDDYKQDIIEEKDAEIARLRSACQLALEHYDIIAELDPVGEEDAPCANESDEAEKLYFALRELKGSTDVLQAKAITLIHAALSAQTPIASGVVTR